MSFKLQQIANYLHAGQLNSLDYNNGFSFRFRPASGSWDIMECESENGHDCIIYVQMTDDGFSFVIDNNDDDKIYCEPIDSVTRLIEILNDWENQLKPECLTNLGTEYLK